jgi:hypothetical protein
MPELILAWLTPLTAAGLSSGLLLLAAPQLIAAAERLISRHSAAALPQGMRAPPAWRQPLRWTVISSAAAGSAAALLSLRLPWLTALAGGLLSGLLTLPAAVSVTRGQVQRRLDAALTPAVGRLSTQLGGGVGMRRALERISPTLDDAQLAAEWHYLLQEPGRPLAHGGVVTLRQALSVLAQQTVSPRHAVFLLHLAAAADQPHELLARRSAAAYAALQVSARRRAEAQAELAQMRYSGLAIGLAGIIMAGYLAATQWPRMTAAYSGPGGGIAAVLVLLSLAAPLVGAVLLSDVAEIDY